MSRCRPEKNGKAAGALLLLMVLLHCTAQLLAEELPPSWPWRGINLSFPGSKPTDLVRYTKTLGINAARLHIRVNQYMRANNLEKTTAFSDGLHWLDSMLEECKKERIVCIVNYGQFPLGNADHAWMTTQEFWQDEKNLEEVLAVTQKLVVHLAKRGAEFAAYDIISEPLMFVDGRPAIPPAWPGLLEKIVATINKGDPGRWIIVAPGPGGGVEGYGLFHRPAGKNLILGLHMYHPLAFTHQGIGGRALGIDYPGRANLTQWDKNRIKEYLAPLRDFQRGNSLPVFAGEFSAVRWASGGERYIQDLVSIFDEYGWGWAYFNGAGWHGWNPDYNQHYPGSDKGYAWKKDYIGINSERWRTLRTIFSVSKELK